MILLHISSAPGVECISPLSKSQLVMCVNVKFELNNKSFHTKNDSE